MTVHAHFVALHTYPSTARWDVDEVRVGADQLRDVLAEISGLSVVDDTDRATLSDHGQWLAELGASPDGPLLVYWAGHAERATSGVNLALKDSPEPLEELTSLRMDALAGLVRRRQGLSGLDKPWLLVIIDTCQSVAAIRALWTKLDLGSPQTVLLGTSSDVGAAGAGRFPEIFAECLTEYADSASDDISLHDLLRRVSEALAREYGTSPNDHVLSRLATDAVWPRGARPAPLLGVVSEVAALQAVLESAPEDVRNHFFAKASSANLGQVDWHFTGRIQERTTIARWLDGPANNRLLAVTGLAGSGKSALLGMALAATYPELVDSLRDLGRPVPRETVPAHGRFTSAVHLSNRTIRELITTIAEQEGWGSFDGADELVAAATTTDRDVVILADALDESRDPIAIARLLRRLTGTPRCRVLVGTRRSLGETPDSPTPADHALTDALHPDKTLSVEPDRSDFHGYALERLGPLGLECGAGTIAEAIADAAPTFLYVRLAVEEILADPTWRQPGTDLRRLLTPEHLGIFDRAVQRLRADHPTVEHLLHALAHARGNGFPRTGRVWVVAGTAIADHPVTDPDIRQTLRIAAPYIVKDAEFGEEVYRLAHRTFVDYYRPNQAP